MSASIQNTLFDHPFVDNEDHYRLSLGISGSYTLWDGGSTNASVEVNQLKKEAAAQSTKQTERSVQESVLNAYMNLLAAQENKRTADAAVELSQAEFEHYGKLFEAGSITKKDLTQSQSNVLQKQVSQLSAELSVNTSKTNLRQLLELDESVEFEIASPAETASSPDSLEPLPSLSDLQKAIREQQAEVNVKQAKSGNRPTVSASIQNTLFDHPFVGINIPIYDGGSTNNKVLLAQVSESEAALSMQETAKNLENNIEKLYLNAKSADLQWKAAILQVEAETEALAVAEEQRNAGALTYTDYLTQKNNLEKAQVTLVNAKYSSLLARKLLELYQGKLD